MITYIDIEDVISRIKTNFRSLDQTLEAMRNEISMGDTNRTFRGILDVYDGYDNTVHMLKSNIKDLFEELDVIIEADEKTEGGEEVEEV